MNFYIFFPFCTFNWSYWLRFLWGTILTCCGGLRIAPLQWWQWRNLSPPIGNPKTGEQHLIDDDGLYCGGEWNPEIFTRFNLDVAGKSRQDIGEDGGEIFLSELIGESTARIFISWFVAAETRSYSSITFARSSSLLTETRTSKSSIGSLHLKLIDSPHESLNFTISSAQTARKFNSNSTKIHTKKNHQKKKKNTKSTTDLHKWWSDQPKAREWSRQHNEACRRNDEERFGRDNCRETWLSVWGRWFFRDCW